MTKCFKAQEYVALHVGKAVHVVITSLNIKLLYKFLFSMLDPYFLCLMFIGSSHFLKLIKKY